MLLLVGCTMGIISIILSFIELMPWFKAVGKLNRFTAAQKGAVKGTVAYMLYPFRFISLLPMASPLLLDSIVVLVAGGMGLSGGPTAATIALTISAAASLLVKIYRHLIAPRNKREKNDLATWRSIPAN